MPELWIATNNSKKLRELERLLEPLGYALRAANEAPTPFHVVEDRPDFAGNAAKKATTLAQLVRAPAMGDDSGLCVDALDGRPGVYSARYAGEDADDRSNVDKLLKELRDVPEPERTARFVCHVCLADSDGNVLAKFEESCEGVIARAPGGTGGFGYDPVFVSREFSSEPNPPTFASIPVEKKDALSHRGKALRRFARYLTEHPLPTNS